MIGQLSECGVAKVDFLMECERADREEQLRQSSAQLTEAEGIRQAECQSLLRRLEDSEARGQEVCRKASYLFCLPVFCQHYLVLCAVSGRGMVTVLPISWCFANIAMCGQWEGYGYGTPQYVSVLPTLLCAVGGRGMVTHYPPGLTQHYLPGLT